ncbi:hypothetical protein DFJ74DRAFT_659267 [Hyaloraphidium curvatum]|nr:hypothetical protein DFJ74DRAFT_659267 [Hyaloraphidium curvatum]
MGDLTEEELNTEITKAQIKHDMLQEQLQLLQSQVAAARNHLEDLKERLDSARRARQHSRPGSMVHLGDGPEAVQEAPARRDSRADPVVADHRKRGLEKGAERAKETGKKQRLEQLQSMLPPEFDMAAKGKAPQGRRMDPVAVMPPAQTRPASFAPSNGPPPANDGRQSSTRAPKRKLDPVERPQHPTWEPRDSDENADIEKFSNLRITKRLVSESQMDGHMKGRKVVPLRDITRNMEFGDIDGDWVTIGVIAEKTHPRTASNDKKYCVVRLNDLKGTQVNLFLFDEAFEVHYKEVVGSIIAVLNPNIARPQESTDPLGINIDVADKFLKIGTSCDLVICKSLRKDGKPCTMPIDAREGAYCMYHIETNFRNSKNRRQEFASGTGEVTMGPPKKQVEMMALKQQGMGVVRTKPKLEADPEADPTPTYTFGGGHSITLGTKKGAVARPTRLSEEQNQRINEELTKRLAGDKSMGSKHLRLARGIAGVEDVKQEDFASAPTAAFSEKLIRKIGYDPRESMDSQGRRLQSKAKGGGDDSRSHDPASSSRGRDDSRTEKDFRNKDKDGNDPEAPVLARGESPQKKILLFDV